MSKPRIITFYLPQYFPTPFNDKWWEPGFTEWTNVAKAKPLFPGHYQPKLPGALGFYDLRVPETRERQAELAKQAGIESFMYWHYWTDGKKPLHEVLEAVVDSGKPDMGFSLCWANHTWAKTAWNGFKKTHILLKQVYPGREDDIAHFNYLLPAFKDKRYTKVNGKLLFAVFAPTIGERATEFINLWNELARQNGLEGFYFVAFCPNAQNTEKLKAEGYDAVIQDYVGSFHDHYYMYMNFFFRVLRKCGIVFGNDYRAYCRYFLEHFDSSKGVFPCIYPNFDHSPRTGKAATMFRNAEPKLWGQFCEDVFKKCSDIPTEENLVFVKAWNEWGEGNYMEPDRRYGMGYINFLRKALDIADSKK